MFAPARRSYDNSHHVQNKTRLTAGFIYGWRTRIIRAALTLRAAASTATF